VVEWAADGLAPVRARHTVEWSTLADGLVSGPVLRHALQATGVITAAAGDTDEPGSGEVLFTESAGDYVMRVTRGRLRGATLVSMPAFARARIVLDDEEVEAAGCGDGTGRMRDVINVVAASPVPVGVADVAQLLGISTSTARDHLVRAAEAGDIVRLSRGLYVGAATFPEGQGAEAAIAPVDDLAPGTETHVSDPGGGGPEEMGELEASAWSEFQAMAALPAEWFTAPSPDELPVDDGPVHVTAEGRIFGWVARKGVCHDGYTGQCLTIDQLGDVDTSYFLRSRVTLDDGSMITVGAFTMNAGHDNDGTDASTMRQMFDDTRTVAGIVTVGSNEHGMWFSGAAAPWLSEWDLAVFAACAPSGHWRRDHAGRWSLRAVLSVPVPGYPTRLAASAVARSNMALAASAMPATGGRVGLLRPGGDLAALASAVVDEMERREQARAEVARLTETLAPVRAEIAASMAARVTEGG
jgi:hypothetical protein